jgi:hypothetical protein
VEFQLAVLRALPRDINPDVADGWRNNGESLARVLKRVLVPPEPESGKKPEPKPSLPPIRVVVDCDVLPRIPLNLSLEGEGAEHRKMGMVMLEKRDGKLYANGMEVVRYLSPTQRADGSVQGDKLRKELKSKQVLNACLLDALLAHSEFIPDEWKEDDETFFWGTIFRDVRDGILYVKSLRWSHDGWDYRYGVVHETDWWRVNRLAACLAEDLPLAA